MKPLCNGAQLCGRFGVSSLQYPDSCGRHAEPLQDHEAVECSGVRSIFNRSSATSPRNNPPWVNHTSGAQPCLYNLAATMARKRSPRRARRPPALAAAYLGRPGTGPASKNANAVKATTTKAAASHRRGLYFTVFDNPTLGAEDRRFGSKACRGRRSFSSICPAQKRSTARLHALRYYSWARRGDWRFVDSAFRVMLLIPLATQTRKNLTSVTPEGRALKISAFSARVWLSMRRMNPGSAGPSSAVAALRLPGIRDRCREFNRTPRAGGDAVLRK